MRIFCACSRNGKPGSSSKRLSRGMCVQRRAVATNLWRFLGVDGSFPSLPFFGWCCGVASLSSVASRAGEDFSHVKQNETNARHAKDDRKKHGKKDGCAAAAHLVPSLFGGEAVLPCPSETSPASRGQTS
jgi:hypothetical protein